jgi:hypothetical protein
VFDDCEKVFLDLFTVFLCGGIVCNNKKIKKIKNRNYTG